MIGLVIELEMLDDQVDSSKSPKTEPASFWRDKIKESRRDQPWDFVLHLGADLYEQVSKEANQTNQTAKTHKTPKQTELKEQSNKQLSGSSFPEHFKHFHCTFDDSHSPFRSDHVFCSSGGLSPLDQVASDQSDAHTILA